MFQAAKPFDLGKGAHIQFGRQGTQHVVTPFRLVMLRGNGWSLRIPSPSKFPNSSCAFIAFHMTVSTFNNV